ncbi:MAG: ComF family protein [Arachnia sp.]
MTRSGVVRAEAGRCLAYTRPVRDQAGLNLTERQDNLAGALRVARRPSAAVVVVDDLLTTGASVREALRAFAAAEITVCGAAVVCEVPQTAGPGVDSPHPAPTNLGFS